MTRAEVVAVGSELLMPGRVETNAAYITAKLRATGIVVGAKSAVADELEALASVFRGALSRSDLVIATGGLGPTEDDLTREAAAAALGRGMRRDAAILDALRARFARFNRPMAPVNEKQADVIDGAVVLENPRGTAPGQRVDAGGKTVVLLPGPPGEMRPMFDAQVLPGLRERSGGAVLKTRILRIASMGESEVEQIIAPLYKTFTNPKTTILGGAGQVELQLTASGSSPEAAEAAIETLARGLRELLPGRIFTEEDRELPEVVGALLKSRGLTLAVAESCTG